MEKTKQLSESPSHASAKDEVLGVLHGADHIDVVAMQRSLRRIGFVLGDWCPLNRESDTSKRSLSVSFESSDALGDRYLKLRLWARRRFHWVGRFSLSFEAVDKIFTFTIDRDREGFTKVYNHLLVKKIQNERTRRTIS